MYVTPGQIRGARGLLNWSQRQLAEASRTCVSTVVKFEKEEKVSNDSKEAIRKALEAVRIEFVEGIGVILRTANKSKAFDGPTGPDMFYNEILATAKENGGELLAVYDTAEAFAQSFGVNDFDNFERFEELSRHVTIKCLLTNSRKSSLEIPMCQFRALPRMPFGFEPMVVCGSLHARIDVSDENEFSYFLKDKIQMAMEAMLDFSSSWQTAIPLVGVDNLKQARG